MGVLLRERQRRIAGSEGVNASPAPTSVRLGVLIAEQLPILRALPILGIADTELSANRIVENVPVGWSSESNRVPEAFGVGIGEEQLPRLASVGCLVEAGARAFAAGHNDSCIGVERLHPAKIQTLSPRGCRTPLPVFAVVGGAQDRPLRPRSPRHPVSNRVDASQISRAPRGQNLPLGVRAAGRQTQYQERSASPHIRPVPLSTSA